MALALKYAAINLKKRMSYKLNFFLLCIAVAPIQIVQLFFSWVIISNFGKLGGWSFWEIAFLYSIMLINYSIAQVFFRHFRYLDGYVIRGQLDLYLTRPNSLLFTLSFSELNIMELFSQLLPSVIVFCCSLRYLNIIWGVENIIILLLGIIGGSIICSCVFILIGLTSFWTYRIGGVADIFFQLKLFLNYPLNVYGKEIIFFLTFIFPLAFINYYPVEQILKGETRRGFLTFPISIFFVLVTRYIWKKALKRYNSSGS